MYYRIINGRTVLSPCKTIQLYDGTWVSNPTAEQIASEGWQVYTPPVTPVQPRTEPEYDAVIAAVKKMLSTETDGLSDEDALDVAALFPTWASKIGQSVTVGERLWYDGKLYKVLQAHTASSEWTPDTAVSLFVEVSIEEFPEIPENIPSTAPWMAGDKGTWQGQHYICKIDNTVHNPSQYPAAWELLP